MNWENMIQMIPSPTKGGQWSLIGKPENDVTRDPWRIHGTGYQAAQSHIANASTIRAETDHLSWKMLGTFSWKWSANPGTLWDFFPKSGVKTSKNQPFMGRFNNFGSPMENGSCVPNVRSNYCWASTFWWEFHRGNIMKYHQPKESMTSGELLVIFIIEI